MIKDHTYFLYILASRRNGTLYIGVTNHLLRRVQEHREGMVPGFTRKYGVKSSHLLRGVQRHQRSDREGKTNEAVAPVLETRIDREEQSALARSMAGACSEHSMNFVPGSRLSTPPLRAAAPAGMTVGDDRAPAPAGMTVGDDRAFASAGMTVGDDRAFASAGMTVGDDRAPAPAGMTRERIGSPEAMLGGDLAAIKSCHPGRRDHAQHGPEEPGPRRMNFESQLIKLKSALGDAPLYLAASHTYRGDDRARIAALAALAERCGTPLVATNDVLYHAAHRRPLQDVLTCIREKTTLDAGGAPARSQRRAASETRQPRWRACSKVRSSARARRSRSSNACRFSLDELVYEYPDEPVPPGKTPQQHLASADLGGRRAATSPMACRIKSARPSKKSSRSSRISNSPPTFSPFTTSSRSHARAASCARGAARRRTPSSAIASTSRR